MPPARSTSIALGPAGRVVGDDAARVSEAAPAAARARPPRAGEPARRPRARRASARARTSGSISCGDALLRDRRRDVAGDRPDRGRARSASPRRGPPRRASRGRSTGRRSRASAPSGTPQPPREPADRPALRDARRDELEEARVADRHVGAGRRSAAAASGAISVGSGGSPTARTFVIGWSIEPEQVRRRARRGRP